MLYIDPGIEDGNGCIDCGACVYECLVEAIFIDKDVPEEWKNYIELNAKESLNVKLNGKNITVKKKPLVDS